MTGKREADRAGSGTRKLNCLNQEARHVRIIKAGPFGVAPSLYNGNFKVTGVPDEKTFEYELNEDPGGNPAAADFSPGYFGRIWQFGRLLIENNVIELAIRNLAFPYGRSIGVFMYLGGSPPQYIGRQLVIRDNVIRHINNASDPRVSQGLLPFARAIEVWGFFDSGVENCLIQKNIIRLDGLTPIEWFGSGVKTFDNNSPEGQLILARDITHPLLIPAPELVSLVQARVEELLLTALLK